MHPAPGNPLGIDGALTLALNATLTKPHRETPECVMREFAPRLLLWKRQQFTCIYSSVPQCEPDYCWINVVAGCSCTWNIWSGLDLIKKKRKRKKLTNGTCEVSFADVVRPPAVGVVGTEYDVKIEKKIPSSHVCMKRATGRTRPTRRLITH